MNYLRKTEEAFRGRTVSINVYKRRFFRQTDSYRKHQRMSTLSSSDDRAFPGRRCPCLERTTTSPHVIFSTVPLLTFCSASEMTCVTVGYFNNLLTSLIVQYTWVDINVIVSTTVTAAMLEVSYTTLQQCNVVNYTCKLCCVCVGLHQSV